MNKTFVETVIEEGGGFRATAQRHGLTYDAVVKWKRHGIPPKHWPRLVDEGLTTFDALVEAQQTTAA